MKFSCNLSDIATLHNLLKLLTFPLQGRANTALISTTLLMALSTPVHANADWTIIDLGTLGGTYSEARSINDRGQIVGFSTIKDDSTLHAFLYKDGVMRDLSDSAGTANSAIDINNAGHVVGYSAAYLGDRPRPFLQRGDVMTIISESSGSAWGINNSGTVVGEALIGPQGENRAFLYKDGVMKDMGTLGGSFSGATAINNFGQVVGNSATTGDSAYHAFLSGRSGMIDLGTLGGTYSNAFAINDKGQVAGESTTADVGNISHSFLYSGNKMHDIGTLGGTFSRALGINHAGQVVGMSSTAFDPGVHAFLYTNGMMIDLNFLPAVRRAGWFLDAAYAIDDAGQIVGAGTLNGEGHAFLLSPARRPRPCNDNGSTSDQNRKRECDPKNFPFGRQ